MRKVDVGGRRRTAGRWITNGSTDDAPIRLAPQINDDRGPAWLQVAVGPSPLIKCVNFATLLFGREKKKRLLGYEFNQKNYFFKIRMEFTTFDLSTQN